MHVGGLIGGQNSLCTEQNAGTGLPELVHDLVQRLSVNYVVTAAKIHSFGLIKMHVDNFNIMVFFANHSLSDKWIII